MTQAQMAEAISVSLRFYQRLEAGENAPSLETLHGALRGLGISYDEFFGIERPTSSETRKAFIDTLSEQEKEIEALKKELTKIKSHPILLAYESAAQNRQQLALQGLLRPEQSESNTPRSEAASPQADYERPPKRRIKD